MTKLANPSITFSKFELQNIVGFFLYFEQILALILWTKDSGISYRQCFIIGKDIPVIVGTAGGGAKIEFESKLVGGVIVWTGGLGITGFAIQSSQQ